MNSETLSPIYLRIEPGSPLPSITPPAPYRAVVVVEAAVSNEWQGSISSWLVATGCRYMVAWGVNAGSWDDSVDSASLEEFDFGEIPKDRFVMTTWHDDEPLEEAFFYCKTCARHPVLELPNVLILHISPTPRESEIRRLYDQA